MADSGSSGGGGRLSVEPIACCRSPTLASFCVVCRTAVAARSCVPAFPLLFLSGRCRSPRRAFGANRRPYSWIVGRVGYGHFCGVTSQKCGGAPYRIRSRWTHDHRLKRIRRRYIPCRYRGLEGLSRHTQFTKRNGVDTLTVSTA